MLEKEFYNWMLEKRTDKKNVASCRKSNCLRVCEFEGDLDVHYDNDECSEIIEKQ